MFSDVVLFMVLLGMIALLWFVATVIISYYKQDTISRSDPLSEGKETSYVFPVTYEEAEAYENQKSELLKLAFNKDSVPNNQYAQFIKTLPDSDRVSY